MIARDGMSSRPDQAMLVVAAAGVALTLAIFLGTRSLLLASYQAELEGDVSTRARLLGHQLFEADLVGRAVSGFLGLPAAPSAGALAAFATPLMAPGGGLQGIGWAPVVKSSDLPSYEAALLRESPGARVFELGPDGVKRPVAGRSTYVPLTHVVPVDFAATPGRGFDLASSAERADAMQRSCETGQPAVTTALELPSDNRGRRFVMFFPVRARGTVAEAGAGCRDGLRGYAIAVVFADALVKSALAGTDPVGLPFVLLDRQAPPAEQLVFRWTARLQPRPTWRDRLYAPVRSVERPLTLGNRRFVIEVTPNGAYLEANHPLAHWLALPVGLLVTILAATFTFVSLTRGAELAATNANLEAALASVRTLQGLLPICAHCKRIRDDKGEWTQVEQFVRARTDAQFSHGICPECMAAHYPRVTAHER